MAGAGGGKISFGFSKSLKKSNLPLARVGAAPISDPDPPDADDKQLIRCVEDSAIKVIGEVKVKAPLVIPMKAPSATAAVFARIAAEVEPDLEEKPPPSSATPAPATHEKAPPANESLESRAINELLRGVDEKSERPPSELVVPVKLPGVEGERESTLEDYENIPVADFGLAMLRGMGWKEEPNKKKKKDDGVPLPRPKGMGLGADKVVAVAKMTIVDGEGEALKLCKGAFVKIIAGKNSGAYGRVVSFDDEGRVTIKTAIGGVDLDLNEFMVSVVSKEEYGKQSKVLNAAKFEEYERKEKTVSRNGRNEDVRNSEKRNVDHRKERRSPSPDRKRDKYDRRRDDSGNRKSRRSRSRSREKKYRDRSRSKERHGERKSEKHHRNKYR